MPNNSMQRDAAMNVDLNDGWDYWPVMGKQVEELRRRYNILPFEGFHTGNSAGWRKCRMATMREGNSLLICDQSGVTLACHSSGGSLA
jgi:hypothetical protein